MSPWREVLTWESSHGKSRVLHQARPNSPAGFLSLKTHKIIFWTKYVKFILQKVLKSLRQTLRKLLFGDKGLRRYKETSVCSESDWIKRKLPRTSHPVFCLYLFRASLMACLLLLQTQSILMLSTYESRLSNVWTMSISFSTFILVHCQNKIQVNTQYYHWPIYLHKVF